MDVFTLHPEEARAWLTRAIVDYELHELFDTRHAGPPVGLAWDATSVGQEDSCTLLVHAAQTERVLSGPPAMAIDFEYIDDGDDGSYRFLLAITAPAPLTVASARRELTTLVKPGAHALDTAMTLLRDATNTANSLYQQLSTFARATTQARRP